METWSERAAVTSVSSSHSTAWVHRLWDIPTLHTPQSAPHTLLLSLSPVSGNSLNPSYHALELPEWKQQYFWPLSVGPNMRKCVKDSSLDQRGKEGESLRHQELMTTCQCCSSATSWCFEDYLWLSRVPQGQAGTGIFIMSAANTTRVTLESWVMEGVRIVISQG